MPKRLIRKSKSPEDATQHSVASRAAVLTVTRHLCAVALGIVKRQTSFQMPARRGEVGQVGTELAQQLVDVTDEKRVREVLGEVQCFLGERQRAAQFSPIHMDECHPPARPYRLKLRRRIRPDPSSELDPAAGG